MEGEDEIEIVKEEERFYLDTSIWLDVYEKRGENGVAALKLIARIIRKNDFILYSDIIIKELKKLGCFPTEINEILSIARLNLRKVHIYKEQVEEAVKLASKRNISEGDAFHAILARDNEAYLISRDWDFQKVKDIVNPRLPEEFI